MRKMYKIIIILLLLFNFLYPVYSLNDFSVEEKVAQLLKENKYSEAYDIAKKNLNISVLNEIILYLLIEKKYEEACEMSEKALMEVEKKHGSNSLKIVPILSSYGTALYYNSKNRECYKKVLEIYKRRLNILILYKGNNHQDVADALHGLAQLYIEFNNPKKASKCYEKAMEIFMLHKDNLDSTR
jgi:tetratricopeptide (TPR) repeat protein